MEIVDAMLPQIGIRDLITLEYAGIIGEKDAYKYIKYKIMHEKEKKIEDALLEGKIVCGYEGEIETSYIDISIINNSSFKKTIRVDGDDVTLNIIFFPNECDMSYNIHFELERRRQSLMFFDNRETTEMQESVGKMREEPTMKVNFEKDLELKIERTIRLNWVDEKLAGFWEEIVQLLSKYKGFNSYVYY